MNINIPDNNPILTLGLLILLFLIGPIFFSLYCGLKPSRAFCAAVAASAGAIICFFRRAAAVSSRGYTGSTDLLWVGGHRVELADDLILPALAAGGCIVFLAAFGLRLWVRWINDGMTPEERQPGRLGVRAWFRASNVTVGLLIVALAWYGADVSPIVSTAVIAALLCAYPILRVESQVAAAPEDLSAGREKIVAMLDAGKLTVEESAELLRALGHSSGNSPAKRAPLGGSQRLLTIGAALVGVGFFLPWFIVNPGREVGQLMNQWQAGAMNGTGFARGSIPGFQTGDISVRGGDIQRGLGWAALALALAGAFLPYIAATLETATERTVRLLCLAAGGVIVVYLATNNFRFIGIGLIIAICGYALEIAGALRERRTSAS